MDALLMQITLQGGLGTLLGFFLGVCLCAIVYQMIARTRAKTIAEDLQRQLDGAKREADNIIKSAPGYIWAMDSLWFIYTDESVHTWSDRLHKAIDVNDYLFVVDIKGQSRQGWMKKDVWGWLNKHD